VVDGSPTGALALGRAYWVQVERTTRGLVRLRGGAEQPELAIGRRGPALLRFGAAELEAGADAVAYRVAIAGGLLTREPAGTFELRQQGRGPCELRSTIRGFHPTLAGRPGGRGWTGALYRQVQARLHVRISRRYFAGLLAGGAR
jgi:hypothetical protein